MALTITRETALTITPEEVVTLDETQRMHLIGVLTVLAGEGNPAAFEQAVKLACHISRIVTVDEANAVEAAYLQSHMGRQEESARRARENSGSRKTQSSSAGPGTEIIKRGLKTSAEILEEGSRELPWIVESLIPSGAITLMTGSSKAGKTTVLFAVLKCMVDATPWAGQEVEKGTAWILTEEGTHSLTEVHRTVDLTDESPHMFFQLSSRQSLNWESVCDQVGNEIVGLQTQWGNFHFYGVDEAGNYLQPTQPLMSAPRMVVVDTLGAWSAVDDMNDYSKLTKAFGPLQRLRDRTRCAIVVVHHQRKSSGDTTMSSLGSVAITAQTDNIMAINRVTGNVREIKLEGRFREGLEEITVTYDPDAHCYVVGAHDMGGPANESVFGPSKEEMPVLDMFEEGVERPMREIVATRPFPMGVMKLRGIIRRLTEAGQLTTNGHGKNSPNLAYRLTTQEEMTARIARDMATPIAST